MAHMQAAKICALKGHRHGDFAMFSSNWLKYLPKNLFLNMKFLLELREGNIKGFVRGRKNYKQFLTTSLQYTGGTLKKSGQFSQVAIHFHPSHPQPKIINIFFCALLGFLLTKLNHYFDDSIDSNMFFGYLKEHKK